MTVTRAKFTGWPGLTPIKLFGESTQIVSLVLIALTYIYPEDFNAVYCC